MNFLQLCQRVQLLGRFEKGLVGTTPTTTLSQSGSLLEIVTWVDQAYQDIQSKHRHWRFLTTAGSFNTVDGTRAYVPETQISTFERLIPYMAQESMRPFIMGYLTATGESDAQPIYFVPWSEFAGGVLDRGTRPEGRPSRFTIQPDGDWEFDPTPDAIYTLTFYFKRTLHKLSTVVAPAVDADDNEPLIPEAFHMAIVCGALRYYTITRDAPDSLTIKYEREYAREMRRLENDQLPDAILTEVFYHP